MLVTRMELPDICSKDLTPDPERVCRRKLLIVLLDVETGGVVKIDCERWDMFRVRCWLHLLLLLLLLVFSLFLFTFSGVVVGSWEVG